jgi:hypothetical protein
MLSTSSHKKFCTKRVFCKGIHLQKYTGKRLGSTPTYYDLDSYNFLHECPECRTGAGFGEMTRTCTYVS